MTEPVRWMYNYNFYKLGIQLSQHATREMGPFNLGKLTF